MNERFLDFEGLNKYLVMQKTIFISYSHDNDAHKQWVRKFADDLEKYGKFMILLDQDLPKGASWTRFMQQGLMMADRVLVIGTQNYKQRSLNTGGVAFEESIISSDYMLDIDTTKYYPILRSGSFTDSFPPILASRNGDDFTDDTKYETNLQRVISEINGERIDKIDILKSTKRNIVIRSKAVVSMNLNYMFETMWGRPTGKIEGIGASISVTNYDHDPIFILEPHFEFDKPVLDGKSAFVSQSHLPDDVCFPKRLEHGEMMTRTYVFNRKMLPLFEKIEAMSNGVSFSAYAMNTLGDIYQSDSVSISHLIEDLKKCSW